MSNNDKNDSKSMGDLFMQRRAAASSGTRTNANAGNAGSSGDDNRSSGKKSFADIQREQQREQQQHTQRGGQYEYGGQRGLSHQRQQQGQQGGQGQFGGQRGGSSHAVDEYGRLSRPSERGGERDRSLRNDPRNDPRGGGGQRRGGGGNMNTMNSRNSRPNNNPRASLPFEQGIIHTLLDKFGFITCADRDRELFFHYSEFKERDRQGHSDDLNIGDEVEFRVGRAEERGRSARGGGASGMGIGSDDGNEKMSAFDVRSLPKGTIQWETEDEPVGERRRGKVERVARDGNSGREERRGRDRGRSGPSSGMGAQDGMIHIVVNDNDNDDKNTAESEQGQGHDAKEERTEIIFAPSDYKSTTPGHSRLDRNDIVEFTLVTLRRTGKKYARNITLIKSERERQREERERKLLEDALLERGVVVVVRGGSSGGNSNDKSSTGEYGFLKSANRMEEVHFNMSHVLFHDADGEGMEKGNETSAAAISLKEGQEVEFYVVNENSGSSTGGGGGGRHKGGGRSLSARKIKLLPKGSVKFEHVLAEGVTGMVVDCPVAASVSSSPFGGGGGGGAGRREDGRRGGSDNRGGGSAVGGGGGGGGGGSPGSVIGKICLERPITINNTVDNNNNGNDNEEEQQQVITQVSLHPSNYPGGTYALSRTGNEIGLWIRPHDVLLFDVVQKVLDGSVWAVPTFRMHPIDVDAKADVDAVNNDSSANAVNKKPARVHLIEPSLCARTAGVVRSVHDNYGFISLAEREGMDAYFPLFEVFPGEVHGDLIANSQEIYMNKISSDNESGGSGKGEDGYGYGGLVQTKGGRINIEVGTEVMLDLSLQMPPPNSGGPSGGTGARGGRYKQNNSRPAVEKESYRARRVQILPKGTIQDKLPIASGVKVKVIKVDARQPFVGTLELEESLKVDTNATREKRYPYVTKLLDDIAKGKYNMNGETDKGVVFHEVLSDKEAQAVISMINSRDDLEWSYVDPGKEAQGHRLCISRKKDSNKELMKKEAVDGMEAEDEPAIVSEASMTSEGSNEQKAKNVALEEAPSASVSDRGTADEALVELQNNNKKRGGKKANKILRMLRFDKLSFPDIAGIGDPLGVGDVLNCDIYQSRRTGLFQAENIMVVSRNQNPTTILSGGEANDARRKDLVGFVSEVVSSRQFGFISQLIEDEERVSKKRGEHVFFHFREIVADSTGAVGGSEGDDVAQDGKGSSPPRSSLSSRSSKKPSSMRGNESVALHKGDEVKFDISQERKNGKLTAVNVRILPRGTLKVPAKAQVAECTGYVLMEPSHTSLANTPSHNTALLQSNATTPASGGGRWANVREDKANKSGANAKEEGVILLLSDPSHLFSPRPAKTKQSKESPSKQRTNDAVAGEAGDVSENKDCVTDGSVQTESHDTGIDINNNTINEADKAKDEAVADQSAPQSLIGTHLRYRLSSVMSSRGSGQAPKRGDLVTFGKARGAKLIKDIRIEKMGAATHVRGILVDIEKDGEDMAVFAVSSLPASSDGGQKDGKEEERYGIKLTEVVSCNKSMLKEREQVDGILHDGKVFGVCRTKDIYLASSFGRNSSGGGSSISSTGAGAGGLKKERPKLNLTVKKEMGGAIMAQSRMAKGPDGTYGFVAGWTKRTSLFMSDASAADVVDEKTKDSDATATPAEESLNMSLSAAASEFVPNFVSPSEEVLQGESDNGGGD